ncbi:hypothetical protein O181_110325 [Austropuccinia psidii MF-1]|uniref:Uncharacterized protein n=1 Tax=Austropuccinia psidii MF-1 TaxID=1389203 RepID=A0A9Q3K055_9BASI|nr:hypothetical protein [Austropuccinia psidii MF-1]
MIKALHGPNDVQLELTGELMNKHPTLPSSLIKSYSSSDKNLFPLRNKPPLEITLLDLVRYRAPTQKDKWLVEKDITNSDKLIIRLRHERRPQE